MCRRRVGECANIVKNLNKFDMCLSNSVLHLTWSGGKIKEIKEDIIMSNNRIPQHTQLNATGTKENTHIEDSQWVKTNVNIVLEWKHLVASGTDTTLHCTI
jgi:hypothetical protein